MNRRDFINLLALQTFFLVTGQKAKAQSSDWGHNNWEGFFVTIFFDGAWDTSLSTNPWIPEQRPKESDYFLEYERSALIQFGNSAVGPTMQAMSPHMKDISIVNGVFMSTNDNGHESLKSYALTGDVHNQRAAFGLELDRTLPSSFFSVLVDEPIPTGIRSNATTQIEMARKAIESSQSDLAESFINNATSGILGVVRESKKQQERLQKAQNLLTQYRSLASSSEANSAVIAAAAFMAGLSRSAVLEPNMNLDSHNNHPGQHITELTKGWETVSEIFKIFKSIEYSNGKSLFDMTTFMITSEFSRTPALNAAKGKDHNPWSNSVVLAGRGIRGGLSIGDNQIIPRDKSQVGIPYLVGLPFDFQSNKVVRKRSELTSNSQAILPQHIYRTLADAMGLNLKVIGGGLEKSAAIKSLISQTSFQR